MAAAAEPFGRRAHKPRFGEWVEFTHYYLRKKIIVEKELINQWGVMRLREPRRGVYIGNRDFCSTCNIAEDDETTEVRRVALVAYHPHKPPAKVPPSCMRSLSKYNEDSLD